MPNTIDHSLRFMLSCLPTRMELSDYEARRKIQNREAQRRYRKSRPAS